jgi:malate dehydrogenase
LLSQSSHPLPSSFSGDQLNELVNRIQFGGDEVVKAKDGAGSATLSMAYAGAQFAELVIRAIGGEKGIVAPTYVHLSSDAAGGAALAKELGKELEYFSARVELSSQGVEKILPIGEVTEQEKSLIAAALPDLESNIEKVSILPYQPVMNTNSQVAAGRQLHRISQAVILDIVEEIFVYVCKR